MIETKPLAPESTPTRRSPVVMVVLVALAVAATGLIAMFLLGGDDETPIDVVQNIASAVRDGDGEQLEGLIADVDERRWYEWLISLEAAPTLTNCTEGDLDADGATSVACDVAFGDSFFYSQVLDETLTTRLEGTVAENGMYTGSSFPPPPALVPAEIELKRWVQENRPELVEDMFASGVGLRFTPEAGELHMDVLEDYLAAIR